MLACAVGVDKVSIPKGSNSMEGRNLRRLHGGSGALVSQEEKVRNLAMWGI